MKETLTLVVALMGLIVPWTAERSPASRAPEGWDFGAMPEDERRADWS